MSKTSVLLVAVAMLVAGALLCRNGVFGTARVAGPVAGPVAGEEASPPMVAVLVPELSGGAATGAGLFRENCESCHGRDAAGREGLAPPLVHRIYEPGHHADLSFLRAVRDGVRQHHWHFGDMPPVEGLSERQVADIVAYVRALQRANGIH